MHDDHLSHDDSTVRHLQHASLSLSLTRSFFVQNAAGVKQVMREIQALSAGVQQLQARMNKLALGKSDEGVVKSKVGDSVSRV